MRSARYAAAGLAVITATLGMSVTTTGTAMANPPGYQVVPGQSVTVPNRQVTSVSCPAGAYVAGGGVYSEPGDFLLRSAPSRDARGWEVASFNPDRTTVRLTAFAICIAPIAGYTIVAGPIAQNVASAARQSVICPSGRVPLGVGGIASGTAAKIGLSALYIDKVSDGTYRANTALNQTTTGNNTLQPIAICAAPPAGYQTINNPTISVPNSSQVNYVSCPTGTVSLSAGMSVPGVNSYIYDLSPATTGGFWEFRGFAPANPGYYAAGSIVCAS
ncbi:hypothetical protein [Saccharothrix obliqua]|uniref:hypothetical protein n=1 Tax=Saccharothrix obliqua TaxID=2861747 RepID=UPI001C5E09DC|nr:hypothetical protein [Saccharothrix obliqua]MBW4718036.1 hypothetical protein [Saccharothrix obliqua]